MDGTQQAFTVRTVPRRLARLDADPRARAHTLQQQIPDEAVAELSRLRF